MRSRYSLIALTLAAAGALVHAQGILTADQFFANLSANYAKISDYEAQISVNAGSQTMVGTVLYKAPTLMRMDFTQPAGQVISYNGTSLIVYVPELRATLSQQTSATTNAAAASGEGLRMLARNYSISYVSGPEPVALSATEGETVVKLLLTRKTVAEGFRTITLSINPTTMLIRRMEGITLAGDAIVYSFSGFRLNQGIPDTRFIYDSPASANVYNNFLFSTDN
jgi:outer membrane lipoprotein-sorting protein